MKILNTAIYILILSQFKTRFVAISQNPTVKVYDTFLRWSINYPQYVGVLMCLLYDTMGCILCIFSNNNCVWQQHSLIMNQLLAFSNLSSTWPFIQTSNNSRHPPLLLPWHHFNHYYKPINFTLSLWILAALGLFALRNWIADRTSQLTRISCIAAMELITQYHGKINNDNRLLKKWSMAA